VRLPFTKGQSALAESRSPSAKWRNCGGEIAEDDPRPKSQARSSNQPDCWDVVSSDPFENKPFHRQNGSTTNENGVFMLFRDTLRVASKIPLDGNEKPGGQGASQDSPAQLVVRAARISVLAGLPDCSSKIDQAGEKLFHKLALSDLSEWLFSIKPVRTLCSITCRVPTNGN